MRIDMLSLSMTIAAGLAGTVAVAQPSAGGNTALAPITKWQLDYQAAQCVAAREFGSAGEPTTLVIRPAPNGETYEVLISRKGRGPKLATQLEGTVDFGNGPLNAWLLRMRVEGTDKVLHTARVTSTEMAQARRAKSLRMTSKGGLDATVQLGSMPALMEGLQQCTTDLMAYWNSGPAGAARIAEPAKADMGPLFTPSDFPLEAMQRRQEGSGQFLLLIDDQGKVAGCHLIKTSGIPVFDARACQVIRERGRFKPARDAAGRAVRSTLTTPPIVWRLQ
jgi:protein TonB